jgi:hypothetical protein
MTASILQDKMVVNTASASSVSLAFTSAVTAGSAIHAFGTHDDGFAPSSRVFSTNFSDSFTATMDLVDDTVGGDFTFHAVASNCAGGATTVTLTYGSTTPTFNGLWIREVGGVSANPLDGHTGVFLTTSTTPTTSITNTNSPCLISAFINCQAAPSSPTVDASAIAGLIPAGWSLTGVASAIAESYYVTGSGSPVSALFHLSTTNRSVVMMAGFDEATAAGTVVAWFTA